MCTELDMRILGDIFSVVLKAKRELDNAFKIPSEMILIQVLQPRVSIQCDGNGRVVQWLCISPKFHLLKYVASELEKNMVFK